MESTPLFYQGTGGLGPGRKGGISREENERRKGHQAQGGLSHGIAPGDLFFTQDPSSKRGGAGSLVQLRSVDWGITGLTQLVDKHCGEPSFLEKPLAGPTPKGAAQESNIREDAIVRVCHPSSLGTRSLPAFHDTGTCCCYLGIVVPRTIPHSFALDPATQSRPPVAHGTLEDHVVKQALASGQRSSASDSAHRPSTSSTLAVSLQTEQSSGRRESVIRPPTSSTSSQSVTQPEWDSASQSHNNSKANISSEIDDLSLKPDEFWPPQDSEDDSEGAEGVGDRLKRTSTAKSGRTGSKIKAMLQKIGRSYDKRYDFLPNDAEEKDRNTLQHQIVLEMLDGKLHLAPVVNAGRVLDLGCGPGDWALEFAKRNPNTEVVIGVDLDSVKLPPAILPKNCQFQVADFNEKWSYDFKFDFVHLRHLGNLPKKELVTTIYENLNPGGWAEFTEWVVSIQSTSNSFTESRFYKWMTYWKLGLERLRTSVYYPLAYKGLLTEVGFKNVTERKYAVPLNPWPPGRQLQKIGSMMALNINTILEPMSTPIFTGVLGWTPEDLESLLAEVRRELADVKMHAFMTLYTLRPPRPMAHL
ncbi:hypothetical protein NUW58_g88 [Xylaria curta]|uniref:Uncharacterized protein n=1 Tax=Xylaria curta TaxID=42375 RepID=A0ACC1PS64_9PEZI|nr:hypothetical protein NUW58_g88 [Xylaria curta]